MSTAVLLISCADQPGLVHAVAEFVLQVRGNVVHAEQHVDREAGVFFQRVEFDLTGATVSRDEVAAAFAPVAERFGMDVLAYAQFAYDATGMAIKAMEKANSVDPAKYNPVLKASNYEGVTGNIQFTKNGSLKNPSSTLYRVRHGAWVVVTTKTGV